MWLELLAIASSAATGVGGYYLNKAKSAIGKNERIWNTTYYCSECDDYYTYAYKARLLLTGELREDDSVESSNCPRCGGKGLQKLDWGSPVMRIEGKELKELIKEVQLWKEDKARIHMLDFVTAQENANLKRERLVLEEEKKKQTTLSQAIEECKRELAAQNREVNARLKEANDTPDTWLTGDKPSLTIRPDRAVSPRYHRHYTKMVKGDIIRLKGQNVVWDSDYLKRAILLYEGGYNRVVLGLPYHGVQGATVRFEGEDKCFFLSELFSTDLDNKWKYQIMLGIQGINDKALKLELNNVILDSLADFHGMKKVFSIGALVNNWLVGSMSDGTTVFARLFNPSNAKPITSLFTSNITSKGIEQVLDVISSVTEFAKRSALNEDLKQALIYNNGQYKPGGIIWNKASLVCGLTVKESRELMKIEMNSPDKETIELMRTFHVFCWESDGENWVGITPKGWIFHGNRFGATLLDNYQDFKDLPDACRVLFVRSSFYREFSDQESKARIQWIDALELTGGDKPSPLPPPPGGLRPRRLPF